MTSTCRRTHSRAWAGDWGGYAPDWNKALGRAYCTVSPAPTNPALCDRSGPDTAADGAFTGGQILRNDDLYYIAGDVAVTDTVQLRAQIYRHEDKGAGNNWNVGWSNRGLPQELPLVIRETLYSIDRDGGLVSLGWDVGVQHWQIGLWTESNTSSAERYNFTNVTGPFSLSHFLGGQPDTGTFAQQTTWKTQQLYIQDTVKLLDERLSLDFGFKNTRSTSNAVALPGVAKAPIPASSSGQFATGSLKASDHFLPQAGLRFQLAPEHELFASYAENIAMFQGGFKLGPQAVSQAVWDSQGAPLKPESSKSLEGGYRFVSRQLQASVAAYDVKFDNRLLQYNPCNSRSPNGPGCGNRFYNVGGVESAVSSWQCCGSRWTGSAGTTRLPSTSRPTTTITPRTACSTPRAASSRSIRPGRCSPACSISTGRAGTPRCRASSPAPLLHLYQ